MMLFNDTLRSEYFSKESLLVYVTCNLPNFSFVLFSDQWTIHVINIGNFSFIYSLSKYWWVLITSRNNLGRSLSVFQNILSFTLNLLILLLLGTLLERINLILWIFELWNGTCSSIHDLLWCQLTIGSILCSFRDVPLVMRLRMQLLSWLVDRNLYLSYSGNIYSL